MRFINLLFVLLGLAFADVDKNKVSKSLIESICKGSKGTCKESSSETMLNCSAPVPNTEKQMEYTCTAIGTDCAENESCVTAHLKWGTRPQFETESMYTSLVKGFLPEKYDCVIKSTGPYVFSCHTKEASLPTDVKMIADFYKDRILFVLSDKTAGESPKEAKEEKKAPEVPSECMSFAFLSHNSKDKKHNTMVAQSATCHYIYGLGTVDLSLEKGPEWLRSAGFNPFGCVGRETGPFLCFAPIDPSKVKESDKEVFIMGARKGNRVAVTRKEAEQMFKDNKWDTAPKEQDLKTSEAHAAAHTDHSLHTPDSTAHIAPDRNTGVEEDAHKHGTQLDIYSHPAKNDAESRRRADFGTYIYRLKKGASEKYRQELSENKRILNFLRKDCEDAFNRGKMAEKTFGIPHASTTEGEKKPFALKRSCESGKGRMFIVSEKGLNPFAVFPPLTLDEAFEITGAGSPSLLVVSCVDTISKDPVKDAEGKKGVKEQRIPGCFYELPLPEKLFKMSSDADFREAQKLLEDDSSSMKTKADREVKKQAKKEEKKTTMEKKEMKDTHKEHEESGSDFDESFGDFSD